jgi:type IV pilus assembly protein PilE
MIFLFDIISFINIIVLELINSLEGAMKKFQSSSGFTLIELMIVIVVIGILATLAVPKYMSVTRKAKESEAKLMLNQVHSLQESYFREHDTYASILEELGFEQEKLISEGGKARFIINLTTNGSQTFSATATSIVDFDKDGNYSVWNINNEGKLTNINPD